MRKNIFSIILIIVGIVLLLIKDVDFTQTSKDDSFRRCMNDIPTESLYSILSDKDPIAAERINRNDKKRIIRR